MKKFFPFSKVIPQLDSLIVVHGSPLEKAESQVVEYEIDNEDNREPADTITVNEDNQNIEIENSSVDQMPEPSPTEEVFENIHAIPSNIDSHIRRTSRSIKETIWMKDYAITKRHSSTKHPMANSLNYEKLKPEYRIFLSKLSECVEPKNFSQAAKDERWIQAMQQEIKAL